MRNYSVIFDYIKNVIYFKLNIQIKAFSLVAR